MDRDLVISMVKLFVTQLDVLVESNKKVLELNELQRKRTETVLRESKELVERIRQRQLKKW